MDKNGSEQQLLSREWVADCASPTPADWGACPYYSHFMWRKDLNYGNKNASRTVPKDAFYTYGGGGQFAVVVPSLDLVVVILYGAQPAMFLPPPDVHLYKNNQFFPSPSDRKILSLGTCCGGFRVDGVLSGCWNWTTTFTNVVPIPSNNNNGNNGKNTKNDNIDGVDIHPGMPSCDCTTQNTSPHDLLSEMMQRVVAAVID